MKKIIIVFALIMAIIPAQSFYEIKADNGNLDVEKIKIEYKQNVGTVIVGYEGEIPNGDIIIPSTIDGEEIKEVTNEAFKGKGLTGKLILPESINWVSPHSFANNQIEEVIAPGLVSIAHQAFENNNIEKVSIDSVTDIGYRSFYNNEISSLSLKEVINIGEDAFGSNNIQTLFAPNVQIIQKGAFWKEQLEYVDIGSVKKIGHGAFEGNQLNSIELPNVEIIEGRAFYNNKISNLSLPSVVEIHGEAFRHNELSSLDLPEVIAIGDRAFENNLLVSISLPKVVSIGEGSFYAHHNGGDHENKKNKIETAIVPLLKNIGENAFYGNELRMIHLNDMPKNIEGSPFDENNQDLFWNFFPLYVDKISENNIFKDENKIVINPDENYKKNLFDYYGVLNNQLYLDHADLNNIDYTFATARNDEGDLFYCVGSQIHFIPGIYTEIKDVETIYIIEHGFADDGQPEKGRVEQKVSINKEPGNYIYSYDSELISKIIFHANNLFENKIEENLIRNRVVHLVASNPELKDLDLNQDNFRENVTETKMYEYIIDDIGEAFIEQLFDLVENDSRTYSLSSYYYYADNILNDLDNVSQPLIKPGLPIEEFINISVEKEWVGGSEVRPDIEVQLYRDGKVYGDIIILENGESNYTWTELDLTDENGEKYEYTVDEVNVPENYEKTVNGFTITNTYVPELTPEKPVDKTPPTGVSDKMLMYLNVLLISCIIIINYKKRHKKDTYNF